MGNESYSKISIKINQFLSLPNHQKTQTRKKRRNEHICKTCVLSFPSRKSMYAHKRDIHWIQFKCRLCGKQFNNKKGLQNHLQSKFCPALNCNRIQIKSKFGDVQHSKAFQFHFQCPRIECGKIFDRRRYLIKHMQRHKRWDIVDGHQNHGKYCMVCCQSSKDRNGVCIHLQKNINDGQKELHKNNDRIAGRNKEKYACDICDNISISLKQMNLHFFRKHNANTIYI